jgi:hypothetical protein
MRCNEPAGTRSDPISRGFSPARGLTRVALLTAAFACLSVLCTAAQAADSGGGSCPNERFRVGASAGLPDCRAFEMVSPPDKSGNNVAGDSTRFQVARGLAPGQLMAVDFASAGAFAGAEGTGILVDYMGVRDARPGTQGWDTHSLTPPQSQMPFQVAEGADTGYEIASEDLSTGFFDSWSALNAEDPNVANVPDLYRRTDLRSPGAGHYELLSACPFCVAPVQLGQQVPSELRPYFLGASASLSQVLFSSPFRLTAEAPACPKPPEEQDECPAKLYENDHGTVRLVGVLPDGDGAEGSWVGLNSGPVEETGRAARLHAISNDGSRVFFMALDESGNNSVFMRVGHAETVKLNTSESTAPETPAPAQFLAASADGSRVFFYTTERLTDDASGGGAQLYMYDTTKPASDPHNLTFIGGIPEQVFLGASEDGHYVYFLGARSNIDVWHDGTVRLVASGAGGAYSRNYGNVAARVTPDGRHLLFGSNDPGLVTVSARCRDEIKAESAAACEQLFVYSADTGRVQCASCAVDGVPPNSTPSDSVRADAGAGRNGVNESHPLTDDGRRVFFSTADALVPGDTNGVTDAYEFDVADGTVSLLSSGQGTTPSYFLDASPNGDDVFIRTFDRLVGWDHDQNADLYDVRVDGGFPEPETLVSCVADGCQSPASPDPVFPGAASESISGEGNVPAVPAKGAATKKRRSCPRGSVRRTVHHKKICVKKRRAVVRHRLVAHVPGRTTGIHVRGDRKGR